MIAISDLTKYATSLCYNNAFTAFVRKATAAGFNPMIGIFWILPGSKIVGEKIPLRDASKAPSQFKDIEKSHDEVWDTQKRIWGFPEYEYYEITRGRVLFDAKARRFVIISNQETISDSDLTQKIQDWFGIRDFEPILKSDIHYEDPSQLDLWED